MLSLFPKEIDNLPRETLIVLLKYIRDRTEVSVSILAMPLATLECKTVNQYSNEWLSAVVRFLVKQGLVTVDRAPMGAGKFFLRNLKITPKGLRYIDRRWYIAWGWSEVKDVVARTLARMFSPN
jgi:hypothetical protein